MKMAIRKTSEARQTPAERLRRERAKAPSLRAAFPAVELLRLELNFRASADTPASQSHVLHPPSAAFFTFPCPYADCDGQFDLGSAVRAALGDPAHRAQGMLECTGTRSGKHAAKKPCVLCLDYIVTATCRNEV
jgi:hypothetical protein